uniref:Uncharacterized protein n=1 Tax=Trichogloeopsis pedicellata TaxID=1495610 RepID=A0A1G4P0F3_9FLOR|nr:Hypothetical protein ORF_7 [Trichogloeopsis pedicellata]SCW24357.1 Hypothetical protein ORF_7 [Trichogloeopsis pedicellata]
MRMNININSKFIKVWNCTTSQTSTYKVRTNVYIPIYLRILLTNNGSFTRNSTILFNQLTDIMLIHQYTKSDKKVTLNSKYITATNCQRQVWLINYLDKKKLLLLNPRAHRL